MSTQPGRCREWMLMPPFLAMASQGQESEEPCPLPSCPMLLGMWTWQPGV